MNNNHRISEISRSRVIGQPQYTFGKEGMMRYFRSSSTNRMFCRSFVRFTNELQLFIGALEKWIYWNFMLECILFAFSLIYIKYNGLDFPLSHLTNEISYHIKAGFTILILAAVFCTQAPKNLVATVFVASAVISLAFK